MPSTELELPESASALIFFPDDQGLELVIPKSDRDMEALDWIFGALLIAVTKDPEWVIKVADEAVELVKEYGLEDTSPSSENPEEPN